MIRYFTTALILVLASVPPGRALAQETGTLSGKVWDEVTGEELVGANVLLVGTPRGGTTDLNGKFSVRGIPVGTYDVRITYVGYTAKLVRGLQVVAGEQEPLQITLKTEQVETEEVVITAERLLSTESAVLSNRQKAVSIGDGLSAEQIRKAPDATSGDALKRVTGLTVVDNKFVFVRGVTDRYNGTMLNGVSVSSTDTEVDRKSFAFDMIPANLLENTVVVKTATPDMPGDFSGGMVQMNTIDFPSERVIRLGLSSSYNSITSTQGFLASSGGTRDWLGMDDGGRAFPSGSLSSAQLAQQLPNTWASRRNRAPVNGAINLALGDHLEIGASDEAGVVAALTYSDSYAKQEFSEAPTYAYGVQPVFRFDGTEYSRNILWSGLLDLNYKLEGNHLFSVRNSYNQSAQDNVAVAEGINVPGSVARRQSITWNERSLYLLQAGGEHVFPVLSDLEVNWKLFASSSRAEEPDRKQIEYTKGVGDDYALGENYRTWSKLNEKSRGASVDFAFDIAGARFKAGATVDTRDRAFEIRAFSALPGRDPQYFSLLLLPLNEIFVAEHFGSGKFQLYDAATLSGAYQGNQRLNGYYAMIDLPADVAGVMVRLNGGARLESFEEHVTSPKALDDAALNTSNLQATDLLPSVNLKISPAEALNVRLAHYQSVNRPEFRELANVLYLDFQTDQNTIGNPLLQRAYIHNNDIRVEYFPAPGEVFAVSYFHKTIANAIEERLLAAPDRYVKTWFNSPSATNAGWELEARVSLGHLTSLLENVMLTANYTAVSSEVEYVDARTDAQGNAVRTTASRTMQGQAPWTMNLGLFYTHPEIGTSLNIMLNKQGRRLAAVGDVRDYDIFEEPRDMVDVSISQQLFSFMEAKFSVKNLLDKERILTSGEQRVPFSSWHQGSSYSLSLSLNL
ncbi:MAG TPA: carboxypeptidase-like regulatory domain-containing protein [Bacteroidota bacterium]|nr:carboxypeptidase-like regulatory domain-containing protein [Bacteroidota bacterium]